MMSEGDPRRSARLSKQPEIEDDDDEALPGGLTTNTSQPLTEPHDRTKQASADIPCPTVEPASSSSEASPDESCPTTIVTTTSLMAPLARKQTLTRTPALEGTSPPPDSLLGHPYAGSRSSSQDGPLPNGTSTANGGSHEMRSKKKGGSSANQAKEFLLASHTVSSDSGRGTMDNDATDIPIIAGDINTKIETASPSTMLYKDSSGVDLQAFFKSTLHKSAKDRKTLLSLEKDFIAFIADTAHQSHKMNEMNTYDRMVAHRVAAYLGLDHNVDQSGKCIIVSRTAHTRIPEKRFNELIDPLDEGENQPKKKILQRKPCSLDEKQTWNSHRAQFGSNKAKSLEEREQKYSEARQRIFNKNDEGSNLNPDGSTGSSHLLSTHHHHPYMPQQRSLDSLHPNMHLLSSSSPATGAKPALWSSTESGYGTGHQGGHLLRVGQASPSRATIIKSHSYCGHASSAGVGGGGVSNALVAMVPQQHQHQQFQQQPCSTAVAAGANYKALNGGRLAGPDDSVTTQFERSASVPSNSATPTGSDQSPMSRPSSGTGQSPMGQAPQYPVTYIMQGDLSAVPPGSLIFDANAMEPQLNPDGSQSHFDPACPPPYVLQSQPLVASHHIQPEGHVLYQKDTMTDLASRFEGASLVPVEGLAPANPEQIAAGQPLSFVSSYGRPAQTVLSSTQPAQYSQPVYFTTSPSAGGQPVQYIAYPMPPSGQQQQLIPLDGQAQANLPMPTVGMPAFPSSPAGYQVIAPAGYPLSAGSTPLVTGSPQCVDLGNGLAYAASPDVGVGRMVATGHQALPHNIVQTYSLAHYPANQQPQQPSQPSQLHQQLSQPCTLQQAQAAMHHPHLPAATFQYSSSSPHHNASSSPFAPANPNTPPSAVQVQQAASFYTGIPLASPQNNPKPPSPIHPQSLPLPAPVHQQPSASSSQKSQQQHHPSQAQPTAATMYYSPTTNLGTIPMSQVAIPFIPVSGSTAAVPAGKHNNMAAVTSVSAGAGLLQNPYRSSPPPQQPLQQSNQHHQPSVVTQSAALNPHHHHPHQHHQQATHQPQQQQQHQPTIVPSNGVHHQHSVAVNYGGQQQSAMTFAPAGQQASPQLVAFQGAPGFQQMRPMGTAVFPVAQPGAPTSYQIVRAGRPVQDVRMVPPNAFRPRMPSLSLAGSYGQQNIRHKGSNQGRYHGKGGKKSNGREGTEANSSLAQTRSLSGSQAPTPLMSSTPANIQ